MVKQLKGLLVALIIAAMALGLMCSVCFAADKGEPVTIDLKDVDVKTAIDALFSGTGIGYAVDSQVAGVVSSFSVKDTPFEVALKTLVKANGLVYRVDNGIYIISKKPETTDMGRPSDIPSDIPQVDTTTTSESIIDKVPLNHTGASELLNMMNGNTNSNNGYGTSGMGMSGMGSFGGSSFGGSSFGSSSGFGNSSFGSSSSGGWGSSSGSSGSRSW